MILGAICTRRCPFCDVAHGRPLKADAEEPVKLAANNPRYEAEIRGHYLGRS